MLMRKFAPTQSTAFKLINQPFWTPSLPSTDRNIGSLRSKTPSNLVPPLRMLEQTFTSG